MWGCRWRGISEPLAGQSDIFKPKTVFGKSLIFIKSKSPHSVNNLIVSVYAAAQNHIQRSSQSLEDRKTKRSALKHHKWTLWIVTLCADMCSFYQGLTRRWFLCRFYMFSLLFHTFVCVRVGSVTVKAVEILPSLRPPVWSQQQGSPMTAGQIHHSLYFMMF